jgi:hypothetical protein
MHTLKAFILLLSFAALPAVAQDVRQGIKREVFYSSCAKSFPKNLFNGESRKTFDGIFDYWESMNYKDSRWLAYILATAYRESGGSMQPVREGMCSTDKCSIDAVTELLKKNNRPDSDNYAIPVQGKSYYGRGLVQITHKHNYARVGKALGWGNDLVSNPDLTLNRDKAITILVEGSVQGMFSKDKKTGEWRKLSTYFNDQTTDWVGARSIINPGSKRAHIPAEHARNFHSCLRK